MDGNGTPPVRIFLRPVGSPVTIGMAGLAIASLVKSGMDLRWIALSQSHSVGLILLSVPFVLQLIACLFSYLARDGAAGATLGVLSLTWFGTGLLLATSVPGSRSGALGLMLLASGSVVILSAIAVSMGKPLPAAVFFLEGILQLVTGVYYLGAGNSWQKAAGIIGLIVAGGAAYCVLAFELEDSQRRPVLPTFRIGRGRDALMGDASARVDGVAGDAGVRQMT